MRAQRRWARAKTGEGQVVLIAGEAGIGKSRLTAALLERLGGEPHTRLRYFCSPQHTDSALYPIIGQMERAAALTHEDTPQERLVKLDALLAQTSTRARQFFNPLAHAKCSRTRRSNSSAVAFVANPSTIIRPT
jgi:predicted ATPase